MSDVTRPACDRVEEASLYALHALPPAEGAAYEAHLSTCAACRLELERLEPVVDALVAWPRDVLRPGRPRTLWGRIAQRVAADTGQPVEAQAPSGWREPDWQEVAPGICTKLLATDDENYRVSMLVRLAPNTAYPPHRHAGTEELHLLDGVLIVDDRTLFPGDYIYGPPGTSDARVFSETGCTCILITSTRDELR